MQSLTWGFLQTYISVLSGRDNAGLAAICRLVAAADHLFAGLRAAIVHHEFRADLVLQAFAINAVLTSAGVAAFLTLLDSARKAGSLLERGE